MIVPTATTTDGASSEVVDFIPIASLVSVNTVMSSSCPKATAAALSPLLHLA